MTDVVEGNDAKAWDSLTRVVGDVGAGSWIGHTPHEAARRSRSF
jgi:hypothetical protein